MWEWEWEMLSGVSEPWRVDKHTGGREFQLKKQFERRLGAGKERKCMDIIQERYIHIKYKTRNDFLGKTRWGPGVQS